MSSLTKAQQQAGALERGPRASTELRERRLMLIGEKMLEGMSRRMLVEQAMHCFQIGRRSAQKYVARAERRLHDQAHGLSPLFYLELTRQQRDKLLEGVMRRVNADDVEPKLLAELVTVANRVMDSRDRAATVLFECRSTVPAATVRVPAPRTELLRGDTKLEPGEELAEEEDEELCQEDVELERDAADWQAPMPPEFRARIVQKIREGNTPLAAVDLVLAERQKARRESKACSEQDLGKGG